MKGELRFLFGYMKHFTGRLVLATALLTVLSVLSILPAYIYQIAIDNGIMRQDYHYLLMMTALLGVIYLGKSVVNYAASVSYTRISQYILFEIHQDLLTRLLRLPISFFEKQQTGYILSRVGETANIGTFFSLTTFRIVTSLFEFVAVLIILLGINVKVTLLMLLLMPVFYLVSKRFVGGVSQVNRQLLETGAKAAGKTEESIAGIEEIKNLGVEEQETAKNIAMNKQLVQASIKQGVLFAIGTEALVLLTSLASVLLLFLGGREIIFSGFTIGGYVALANYIGRLYAPVQQFGMMALTLQPAFNSLARVREIMEELTEDEKHAGTGEIGHLSGRIRLENVSFTYPGQVQPAVRGVRLEIRPGEKVLIQGANGSGKSTLMKLLLGMYDTYEGQITYDDLDQKQFNMKKLRERFGIISQNIFLFNDTVRKNITYASKELSDEEYQRILRITGLAAWLGKYPEKDQKLIEKNGGNLSGGQRQLIALGRALAKKADLFIFDEATAHVDPETVEMIKAMISTELAGHTCIIISHQAGFEELADRVAEMRNGRIAAVYEVD